MKNLGREKQCFSAEQGRTCRRPHTVIDSAFLGESASVLNKWAAVIKTVSLCCNTVNSSSRVALWELWLREPPRENAKIWLLGCDRLSFVSNLGVVGSSCIWGKSQASHCP